MSKIDDFWTAIKPHLNAIAEEAGRMDFIAVFSRGDGERDQAVMYDASRLDDDTVAERLEYTAQALRGGHMERFNEGPTLQ